MKARSPVTLTINMNSAIKLLDVVALLEDLPELNLYRGHVGTIVEVYEPVSVKNISFFKGYFF
jgi:Domain of unknown function (DUF4926)